MNFSTRVTESSTLKSLVMRSREAPKVSAQAGSRKTESAKKINGSDWWTFNYTTLSIHRCKKAWGMLCKIDMGIAIVY